MPSSPGEKIAYYRIANHYRLESGKELKCLKEIMSGS